MIGKRARTIGAALGAVLVAALLPRDGAGAAGLPRGAEAWSGAYAMELRLASATR